jgi:hypothetical protein
MRVVFRRRDQAKAKCNFRAAGCQRDSGQRYGRSRLTSEAEALLDMVAKTSLPKKSAKMAGRDKGARFAYPGAPTGVDSASRCLSHLGIPP